MGRRPVVAICGSGNGGHALAVVLSQNFEGDINWLIGSEDKADLLRRRTSAPGLHSTGVIEGRADRLRTISSDPAEVIPEANIVMIVVPAFGHATVLERIKPYVRATQSIGCLPTRGGFEFEASRLISDRGVGGRPTLFGLQTLPWSTRVVTLGETVNFGAEKAKVVMAALPAKDGPGLAGRLSKLFGTSVVSTDGFVNLTLGNPGQYIHPGLMYGHFRDWNGERYTEDTIPMFYAEATDEMGHIVERLSFDAIAAAQRIEEESQGRLDLGDVAPVHEWLQSSYSHVTGDVTTVATCFRTGPIQARKAPVNEVSPGRFAPDFGYRYLKEDIPFGLVVTRAFAEIADVPTPMIDEVIAWAQTMMQKLYLVDGRLEGPDARDLPIPQNFGIHTLPDLFSWYDDYAAARSPKSHAHRAP